MNRIPLSTLAAHNTIRVKVRVRRNRVFASSKGCFGSFQLCLSSSLSTQKKPNYCSHSQENRVQRSERDSSEYDFGRDEVISLVNGLYLGEAASLAPSTPEPVAQTRENRIPRINKILHFGSVHDNILCNHEIEESGSAPDASAMPESPRRAAVTDAERDLRLRTIRSG